MTSILENKIKGSYVEPVVCEMLACGVKYSEIIRKLEIDHQFKVSWPTLDKYVEKYFSKMEAKVIDDLKRRGLIHRDAEAASQVKLEYDYTNYLDSRYRLIDWHEKRMKVIEAVMQEMSKDANGELLAIKKYEKSLMDHHDAIVGLRRQIFEMVPEAKRRADFTTNVIAKTAEQAFEEFKVDYPGPKRQELAARIQKAMKRVQV